MDKIRCLLNHLGLFISILFLSGCGTVVTLTGGIKSSDPVFIYSGVRYDVPACIPSKDNPLFYIIPFIAMDIPLSACADTIVLPYTIYRTATEPRKIVILCYPTEAGAPSFIIMSDIKAEDRREGVSLQEVCAILSSVSGKPASVEVWLSLDMNNSSLSVDDFGDIYNTIESNPTLTLYYRPVGDARNLLDEYLYRKKK